MMLPVTLFLTDVGHLRHDVLDPRGWLFSPGPLPPEWVAHFTGIRIVVIH